MNGSRHQPVLLSGLFIGTLSALPLVNLANCCCLWMVAGGALAAYLTQQKTRMSVPPGQGAAAGAAAGLAGAVVWLVVYAVVDVVVGPLQQRMMVALLDGSVDVPPDVRSLLEQLNEQARSPLRFAAGFFFQLVTGVTFGSIGGLLGAMYFRRDVPPALGGNPIEPPPIPE
jgi:hypothetical protein